MACNTAYLEQPRDQPQNASDIVKSIDLKPRYPQPTATVDAGGANVPKPFSFFGSFSPAPSSPGATGSPSAPGSAGVSANADVDTGADGYNLNFENAPVANVAKSVLGDVLGVGYVIDPRVQGSISLSSGRPIPKKDMLFVLENALHANNLVMVREGSGYRIAPAGETAAGGADQSGVDGVQPGYGVTVVPLRYVSGSTLLKLLEGFAARPGALRTDASGRILVVVGTGSEREAALDVVRNFDVDWLRGQSVGMYPVQNSTPEPIVAELEKIMDSGDSGLGHGLVKFEAVTRLNSVLVVAAKPDLLRAAARWIARLDEPSTGTASVKVYKVRYGDAKEIAQLLTQIFVTSPGASSALNEIAPSSGTKSLTPFEKLTGGRSQSMNASSMSAASSNASNSNAAGGTPGSAAAQFGAMPVAALNSELSANGGQGAGGPQLPNVRITADPINNSVLVYANASDYKLIERTLNQLDRPKLQVAIDVTIAEVDLNDQLNYGVQFFLHNGALSNTTGGVIPSLANSLLGNSSTANSATGGTTVPVGPPLGGGLNAIIGNSLSPRVVINALHDVTNVKILSNPSLVVVDNGEATLQVGDQIPVSTGSATVLSANNAVVNTTDYQNTGIILHVKPRVNSNGSVLLDLDQEISQCTTCTANANNPNLTPTISERKVSSTISVVSGQTVLLAGLIQDQQDADRQGIPMLTQIPIVGGAFGTTGKTDIRTELIIFIRPQIIRDGADASRVAEELRSKLRGDRVQALTLPSMLNVNSRPLQ